VEDKKNVTTGFSGTNDNRYLLPTSITQEDPNFVLGTNALVLQYLLRPENDITNVPKETTASANLRLPSCNAWSTKILKSGSYWT
jgi:hypothetical protein